MSYLIRTKTDKEDQNNNSNLMTINTEEMLHKNDKISEAYQLIKPNDSVSYSIYEQSNSKHYFGSYLLDKVIGQGNFSVVKLAVHIPTKMQVAVKLLHKAKMNSETLAKTYREVQIMKKLSHPNIVQLYQVIESTNWMFIVMEYVSHGELFEYLSQVGKLSEGDARTKFRQILDAVEYCHRKKIVHRDLKAENLLMDDKFNIKLADFGFGSFFDESYLLSTWCGSPPYAAPELFKGEPYIGPKADIWSLGVVLYAMVCGSLPFDERFSIVKLREQVLSGWIRFPYFLSYDCEHLIRIILNREPIKRPSIPSIKSHKWMQIDSEKSSAAIDSSTPDDFEFWNAPIKGRSYRRYNAVSDDSGFDEPLDFIKSYSERSSLSITHNFMNCNVNESVLQIMEQYGISRSAIVDELNQDTYGSYTAMYLLLCEKHRLSPHTPYTSETDYFPTLQPKVSPPMLTTRFRVNRTPTVDGLKELDFCMTKITINENKSELQPARRSPYDNIVTRDTLEHDANFNNNNSQKDGLSETSVKDHRSSVLVDLVIPHEEVRKENLIEDKKFLKTPNCLLDIPQHSNERLRKSEVPSNVVYADWLGTIGQPGNLKTQASTTLNPRSTVQFSRTVAVPGFSVPEKNLCQGLPNSMTQRSTLYGIPNNIIYEHVFYGHSTPVKSTLINGLSPTTRRPQMNKFIEVPISHVPFEQERICYHSISPHNCQEFQSSFFETENDSEPSGLSYQRSSQTKNDSGTLGYHVCDSVSAPGCNHQPRNKNTQTMLPISENNQTYINPSLSSGNQSFSSYSETYPSTIPQYNFVRVPPLPIANLNFIQMP